MKTMDMTLEPEAQDLSTVFPSTLASLGLDSQALDSSETINEY